MSNRILRKLPYLALGFGLSISTSAFALVQNQTNFDSDPNFDGLNNRVAPQDFGFSNTSHIAGSTAGEIGGFLVREDSPAAYYGFDTGALSLNDPLTISGKFNLVGRTGNPFPDTQPSRANGQGSFFGFFNSTMLGNPDNSRPDSALGWRWDDRSMLAFVNSAGGRLEEFAHAATDATTQAFSVVYDPTGDGTLSVSLDGAVRAFPLPAGIKSGGATFDRFGILSTRANGGVMEIYYDDLGFTSVNPIPEPASLGLLSLSATAMLRRRRQ